MSLQQEQVFARPAEAQVAPGSSSLQTALLRWLLGGLECGELMLKTPSGEQLMLKGRLAGARARISIHTWRVASRVLFASDIGFAESYMAGEWSSPDLSELLKLADSNSAFLLALKRLRQPRPLQRLRHAVHRNTRRGSRRNVAAHYDLGNMFYQRWLDAGMNYSAGLYSSASQGLEAAQDAKLDRVLKLLNLTGDERVLEIGCGWGGFAERLLQKSGCDVTGITLSKEQLAYARDRLGSEIARGRCDLRLLDYRDAGGSFDRIVSIEMLEAVGQAYWPTYFKQLRDRLAPQGIAVLQVITIDENRFERYRRNPDFIQRYVFPGGMLPTVEIIREVAARAGLDVVHSEFFGDNYARTLAEWRRRFDIAWPSIKVAGCNHRFKRMWEYYLAYCQAGFETGRLDVGLYKMVHAGGG